MTTRSFIPDMPHRVRRLSAATALILSAAVGAACADDPAPLFEPSGTGDIAGRLFYDADNNARFSPIGGDTVLAGVLVRLLERNSDEAIDSVRTSATGEFAFDAVKPGTHAVFIVDDPVLTADLVFCQNPLTPSVYIDELAFLTVPARGGCVIRIRAAKDTAQGRPVTIAGVVTAGQGTYRSNNIYLQDFTGGMQVFGLPAAAALQLGDSVEISGDMGQFGGELQIVNPVVAPNIVRGGGAVPDPAEATPAQIAESVSQSGAKSQYVGLLMVVRGVTVGAFSNNNAPIGGGDIDIRLDQNVASAIPESTFEAGTCYDIVGLLGFFNGTPQIKPRALSDVTEVPCP